MPVAFSLCVFCHLNFSNSWEFSILLGVTSAIKNKTRIIEKKIHKIDRRILIMEKDVHETELDYFYVSSPKNLSAKIQNLSLIEYRTFLPSNELIPSNGGFLGTKLPAPAAITIHFALILLL